MHHSLHLDSRIINPFHVAQQGYVCCFDSFCLSPPQKLNENGGCKVCRNQSQSNQTQPEQCITAFHLSAPCFFLLLSFSFMLIQNISNV